MTTDPRVADLGEAEILRAIFAELDGSSRAIVGPGDDAAVLSAPGGEVVVTTDTLVHGPDFRLAWSSPRDLGFKSAAVNLADVAAMGARPTALFVALAIPGSAPLSLVTGIAAGLREACDRLAPGCAVEGGDLTVSDTLTIAVTAIGVLDGVTAVRRNGARVGDVVALAGNAGLAATGLDILFDRFRDSTGAPISPDPAALTAQERLALEAQLRPAPPISAGPLAAAAGATAMMDVSDGLALDARRLAAASGVTLAFDSTTLGENPALALRGGEDHALLATFPADAVLPRDFRRIGVVVAPETEPLTVDGQPVGKDLGWDPYRDWDQVTG